MQLLFLIATLLALHTFSQERDDSFLLDHFDHNKAIEFYKLAKADYEFKDYLAAIVNFRKAATLNPNGADYHYGIASSFYELREYDSAVKYVEQAILLEPNQPDYHYRAGNIYFHLRQHQQAFSNYTIALNNLGANDIFINDVNCSFNRGVSAFYLEKYQQAIEDLTFAIEMDDMNIQAIHMRGVSYLRAGDKELACRDFKNADELGNDTSLNYINKYCK